MFKSIKTGVVAALLIGTALYAQAQKKVTEGTLTYGMEYALTDEQQPMAAFLPKETVVKFKNELSTIKMEQGPAMITVIINGVAKNGLLLLDIPIAQKQFAVKMDKAELDKRKEGSPKFLDFKPTGEKQTVGTFNAEKYTYKDDKGGAYELWTTTDLELPAGHKEDDFVDIKGTPVKYTVFQNGIKTTMTLKNYKEEKIPEMSLTPPSGYELKTMDELKAMQGGGQ